MTMTIEAVPLRDGNRLKVRCIGRGEPAVLLHGFGSQSAHWLPNVLPLTRQYRFILPDMRGFGGSHDLSFDREDVFVNMAEDLEDVFDHFSLDNVILGGISTGAYVCLTFNQLGHFNRVSRYLNIEHPVRSRNSAAWQYGLFGERQDYFFSRFNKLHEMALSAGTTTPYQCLTKEMRLAFRSVFADLFYHSIGNPVSRRLLRWLIHVAEPWQGGRVVPVHNWYAYLQVMNAFMGEHDTQPGLASLNVPMTLFVGMRSEIYPAAGQLEICDHVPHARVVQFDRASHIPIIDQPIKFQREFSRFIRCDN